MPILEFLYLCVVIVAFLAFGLTLAWGQYRTQNLVRPEERQSAASADDHGFKKAA
jgi:hypothetical protein